MCECRLLGGCFCVVHHRSSAIWLLQKWEFVWGRLKFGMPHVTIALLSIGELATARASPCPLHDTCINDVPRAHIVRPSTFYCQFPRSSSTLPDSVRALDSFRLHRLPRLACCIVCLNSCHLLQRPCRGGYCPDTATRRPFRLVYRLMCWLLPAQ